MAECPAGMPGTQITNKTLGEIPEGLFYKGLVNLNSVLVRV